MPLFVTSKDKHFFPQGAWRRSFFVTLFFVSLASHLFWLDTFRGYESEARVLVIGKSPSAATEQVVENIAELASNLSFYERVLTMDDRINDDFIGYSQDKRKALWNDMVVVERSDNSGVLIVTARHDTREEARRWAEATVKTLFSVVGFYYNIQTDVDLRVVDETIVVPALQQPIQYVAVSTGSALLATILFFWLLSVVPSLFGGQGSRPMSESAPKQVTTSEEPTQQGTVSLGSSVPYIDPRKFIPARPTALSFESSHEEQRIRQEILTAMPSVETSVKKSITSERMLPGMDVDSLPFELEETLPIEVPQATAELQAIAEEPEKAPIKQSEPTIEEYKRRLNELLAGGK